MLARSTALRTEFESSTLQQAMTYRPEYREYGADFGPFTFAAFGKVYRGKTDVNWSLRHLQKPEDMAAHPELCARLTEVFTALDVDRVFAPSPIKFNAEFVPGKLLKTHFPLSPKVSLYRGPEHPADVSLLEPGEAGAFSAGGCPLIVATYRDMLAYAHAGRDCLIDRRRIANSIEAWRAKESVVDTVMKVLRARNHSGEIKVWVYGSLAPRHYPHPLTGPYATFNRAMRERIVTEWGPLGEESVPIVNGAIHLDMPRLIRAQFVKYGVPAAHVHLQHAYLPHIGAWHDGTKDTPRNLMIVAHTP